MWRHFCDRVANAVSLQRCGLNPALPGRWGRRQVATRLKCLNGRHVPTNRSIDTGSCICSSRQRPFARLAPPLGEAPDRVSAASTPLAARLELPSSPVQFDPHKGDTLL